MAAAATLAPAEMAAPAVSFSDPAPAEPVVVVVPRAKRPKRQTAAQLIAEARRELARGPRGGLIDMHRSISHDVALGSTCMFLQKGTDKLLEHHAQPRFAPRYARGTAEEREKLRSSLGAIVEPEPEPEPEPEQELPLPPRPRSLEPLETPGLARFDLAPPDDSLIGLYMHPLERADPAKIYPQFNGGWVCDGCGVAQSAEMYHCSSTDTYDLCGACVQKGAGYSIDTAPDEEDLPRLPSRGGIASNVALGSSFRMHDSPDRSRGAPSPAGDYGPVSSVGRWKIRDQKSAQELELSRQEFFAIYRQHNNDEVRAVMDVTAQAVGKYTHSPPVFQGCF